MGLFDHHVDDPPFSIRQLDGVDLGNQLLRTVYVLEPHRQLGEECEGLDPFDPGGVREVARECAAEDLGRLSPLESASTTAFARVWASLPPWACVRPSGCPRGS